MWYRKSQEKIRLLKVCQALSSETKIVSKELELSTSSGANMTLEIDSENVDASASSGSNIKLEAKSEHLENRLDGLYLWLYCWHHSLDRDLSFLFGFSQFRRCQASSVCLRHHSHVVRLFQYLCFFICFLLFSTES